MNACEKNKALSEARGYLSQMEYLEKKTKRYEQVKCNKCGLFHIWKKRNQGGKTDG